MKIELAVPCSAIEDMLCAQYRLEESAKLTRMEHDELSDVVAFSFEIDDEDSDKIDREWDDDLLAFELIEEAI